MDAGSIKIEFNRAGVIQIPMGEGLAGADHRTARCQNKRKRLDAGHISWGGDRLAHAGNQPAIVAGLFQDHRFDLSVALGGAVIVVKGQEVTRPQWVKPGVEVPLS